MTAPLSPRVSAVIPTYLRPQLVRRAVVSALVQTMADLEVVVVVDGRDAETRNVLAGIGDSRVRIVVPDSRLGNADARNEGVHHARAKWVAFLDDDDEWLPGKLEAQLHAAERSAAQHPIITCRMLARSDAQTFLWPRRAPSPGEPLSEYFFCRRTPFTGGGMVVNSGLLTTRALVERVPFRSGLERHVDPDWLLRATREEGAVLELVPGTEPLLVWHIEETRPRITTGPDWEYSLRWARENRDLFTARGYAAFLLHVVSASAAAQHRPAAFFRLLREAVSAGRPGLIDVLSHAGNFLAPAWFKRSTRGWYARVVRA